MATLLRVNVGHVEDCWPGLVLLESVGKVDPVSPTLLFQILGTPLDCLARLLLVVEPQADVCVQRSSLSRTVQPVVAFPHLGRLNTTRIE